MTKLELKSVYDDPRAKKALYDLMAEREPHQNISHRAMPSFEAHCGFVDSAPYKSWDLILRGDEVCGAVYLSRQDEIGVFVFRRCRGEGIGREAVRLLMDKHPGVKRFLANVNPANHRSIDFFLKFNFKHIQNTYELLR